MSLIAQQLKAWKDLADELDRLLRASHPTMRQGGSLARKVEQARIHHAQLTAQFDPEALQAELWKPVANEYPDADTTVLLCTKTGEVGGGFLDAEEGETVWRWSNASLVDEVVTAWKHLPPPYRP